jgi:hypothetical protein
MFYSIKSCWGDRTDDTEMAERTCLKREDLGAPVQLNLRQFVKSASLTAVMVDNEKEVK